MTTRVSKSHEMCHLLCQEDNKRPKKQNVITFNKNTVVSEEKGVHIHFGLVGWVVR